MGGELLTMSYRSSDKRQIHEFAWQTCCEGNEFYLLMDSPNAEPMGGWTLGDLASLLFGIEPSANLRIISNTTNLEQIISGAINRVWPFDIILMIYDKETTVYGVESIRPTSNNQVPIGLTKSDCIDCRHGILELQGSVLLMVIRDLEDAAEALYLFFDHAKVMHGDSHIHLDKRTARSHHASLQAFL